MVPAQVNKIRLLALSPRIIPCGALAFHKSSPTSSICLKLDVNLRAQAHIFGFNSQPINVGLLSGPRTSRRLHSPPMRGGPRVLDLDSDRLSAYHFSIIFRLPHRVLHGCLARLGVQALDGVGSKSPVDVANLYIRHAEELAAHFSKLGEVTEDGVEGRTSGVLTLELVIILVPGDVGASGKGAHGELGDRGVSGGEAFSGLGGQVLEH